MITAKIKEENRRRCILHQPKNLIIRRDTPSRKKLIIFHGPMELVMILPIWFFNPKHCSSLHLCCLINANFNYTTNEVKSLTGFLWVLHASVFVLTTYIQVHHNRRNSESGIPIRHPIRETAISHNTRNLIMHSLILLEDEKEMHPMKLMSMLLDLGNILRSRFHGLCTLHLHSSGY